MKTILYYWKLFRKTVIAHIQIISGIQLTTSLLRRLSFTNEEEVNKWSGNGLVIHTKPGGFFYGLRITKNRAKMQYLHELQNYVEDYYENFREVRYSLNTNALKEGLKGNKILV